MSSPPPSRPPSPSPRKGSYEKRQLSAPGSPSLGPLLLWSQSSSCPCTTGKGRALAVQQAPVPAPTPGRCPLWGTCTPHTPCRIAEKPSCNTARSRAQLRPPRGIYRACFAPLLALAVSSNPSWPRGASCISTQGYRWSKVSTPALSLHTARGFQPSACKALQRDLFQRCQEHAARSSVSPGPGPSPLAAGERSQVLLLLSVGREHLPPAPARTHPTDSASGFVDSSETKTWQANLWSAGCLVMNPKYLRAERG